MKLSVRKFYRGLDTDRRTLILAAVTGTFLTLFLLGRLLFSGFSILDDHQIIAWMGADLWSRIASTEVVQFGTSARFRPVMYLAITLQSWLFGKHPLYYHLIEIIWFGVLLWAIAWVAFRAIGILAGLAVLYLVASGHYWGNIWTHSLFAAEQMGALGLGLVIFGLGSVASWFVDGMRTRLDRAIWLTCLGALICIGSKENFLPLVPLNIALLAVAWRWKAIGRHTLLAGFTFVLLQLLICYGILVPNMGKSTDIYGGDLKLSARIFLIFHNLHFLLRPVLSIGAGLAVAGLTWWDRRLGAREIRELQVLAALLLWCGVYACWEQFFYAGQLPMGNRYDFPSGLMDPLLAGAAVYGLLFIATRWHGLNARLSPFAIQLCFMLLTLNLASLYWVHGRLFPLRDAVRISNEHTALMQKDLALARSRTAQHPDWPLIVLPSTPLNYEAVVTLPIWMRFFQIPNPASIVVRVPDTAMTSPFEKGLVLAMQEQSRHGRPGLYQPVSTAVEKALAEGRCYVVEFGTHSTSCIELPYRPNEYYPVD